MSKKKQDKRELIFAPLFPLKNRSPLLRRPGPSAIGDYVHAGAPSVDGMLAVPGGEESDRANFEAVLSYIENAVRGFLEANYPRPVTEKLGRGAKLTAQEKFELLSELNGRDERSINLQSILSQIRWLRAYFEKTPDPTGYYLALNLAAMLMEAYERYDVLPSRRKKGGAKSGVKKKQKAEEFDNEWKPKYQQTVDRYLNEMPDISYTEACKLTAEQCRAAASCYPHNWRRVQALTKDSRKLPRR